MSRRKAIFFSTTMAIFSLALVGGTVNSMAISGNPSMVLLGTAQRVLDNPYLPTNDNKWSYNDPFAKPWRTPSIFVPKLPPVNSVTGNVPIPKIDPTTTGPLLLGPRLVKDINTGTLDSWPYYFSRTESSEGTPFILFRADDGLHGYELWRTEGTTETTEMVLDISTISSFGSHPDWLESWNGRTYFNANDGIHGTELWVSDGTSANTMMVADLNPSGDGSPYRFTQAGDQLFFIADDGVHGDELWVTDGTELGTELVLDIQPGSGDGFTYDDTRYFAVVDDMVYFGADDGSHGLELWRSDGTAAGTILVADININGDSDPRYMTALGKVVVFTANDGSHGQEPWVSDGSILGTKLLGDLNAYFTGDSNPSKFYVLGDTLFFMTGPNTTHSYDLWRTDGTPSGTTNISGVDSYNHTQADCFEDLNGILFFMGDGGGGAGSELWRSDGTSEGTYQVADILPGSGSSSPCFFTKVSNTLYFMADDGAHGRELWATDVSANSLHLVADIRPVGDSIPSQSIALGSSLIFAADDGIHAREPWITDVLYANTHLLLDINTVSADGMAGDPFTGGSDLTVVGNNLFFLADDGMYDSSVWRTRGTVDSTLIVNAGNNPQNLTAVGDMLLFNTENSQLWKSYDVDPWNTNSSLIRAFADFCWDGPCIGDLAESGGQLYFRAQTGSDYGAELWTSNGYDTSLVADINPEGGNSFPGGMTDVGGNLFFYADDGTHGYEVWYRDAISGEVIMPKDIHPKGTSYPDTFMEFDSTLVFGADDSAHGRELWRSDGTPTGTIMVLDINPFLNCVEYGTYPGSGSQPCASFPQPQADLGDRFILIADDGQHGRELWASDGTPTHTYMISDINPAHNCDLDGNPIEPPGVFPCNSNITGSVVMGRFLYFIISNSSGGSQLWRSDGTSEGTQMVYEGFEQVIYSLDGSPLTSVVGDTLFFVARDPAHGQELWQSNGTSKGAKLVMDINTTEVCNEYGRTPGTGDNPCSSFPNALTAKGNSLFFTAEDGIHGRELWVVQIAPKTFLPIVFR